MIYNKKTYILKIYSWSIYQWFPRSSSETMDPAIICKKRNLVIKNLFRERKFNSENIRYSITSIPFYLGNIFDNNEKFDDKLTISCNYSISSNFNEKSRNHHNTLIIKRNDPVFIKKVS